MKIIAFVKQIFRERRMNEVDNKNTNKGNQGGRSDEHDTNHGGKGGSGR